MSLFFIILLSTTAAMTVDGFKRACYVANWSQYRSGEGQFNTSNIDPFLCDYLIYAFAQLNGNALAPTDPNDQNSTDSIGNYVLFNNLRNTNPQLKTFLGVGMAGKGTQPWTSMLSSSANRSEFVNQSIGYLREWKFDGLNLNFEYPGSNGSPASDKQHFTLLVSELRSAFDEEGIATGQSPLLLSAAVASVKATIDNGYEVQNLSTHVDFLNVMTYDFHGSWENVTGFNSPLYARSEEIGTIQERFNIDWAARYWVSLGAPKEKIMLGLATYGRGFQLANPANNGLGAPAIGPNSPGPYTETAGFLSYYEICTMLNSSGTVRVYSCESEVPYAYNGDQWIGYDDIKSFRAKVDYVKDNSYAGVFVWLMEYDDFGGVFCDQGLYPLLSTFEDKCSK